MVKSAIFRDAVCVTTAALVFSACEEILARQAIEDPAQVRLIIRYSSQDNRLYFSNQEHNLTFFLQCDYLVQEVPEDAS